MAFERTLTQLTDDVFAVLRDSERAFITTAQVQYWLNEAYLDLCTRLRVPEKTDSGTSSSTGTIALPADLIEIKRLSFDDSIITWTDNDTFLSYSIQVITPNVPIYRIFGSNIETYPVLDSQAYELEYIGQPTEMTAGSDKPTSLGAEMHSRLVAYARALAKWAEQEDAEGDRYMAQYERGLPDLPRMTYKKIPGPLVLMPLTSPFEDSSNP